MRKLHEKRRTLALSWLLVPVLLAAPPAGARQARPPVDPDGPHVITRLGGLHACTRPPLKDSHDLHKLFAKHRLEIEAILQKSGFEGDPQDLFRAVEDGKITERDFPIGQRMQWMMLRQGKTFDVVRNGEWAGKDMFHGFEIKFDSKDHRYTFIVPNLCGNLALVERVEIPQPTCKLAVVPTTDCLTRKLVIDGSSCTVASGKLTGVQVTMAGAAGMGSTPGGTVEELGAPDTPGVWKWTRSFKTPGTYTFTAVATADSGRRSEPSVAKAEVTPCPPSCGLSLSVAEILTKEEFELDTSASKAQVGNLKVVHVQVLNASGAVVSQMELESPFKVTTHIDHSGTYTLKGIAEDDLGQRSTNSCQSSIVIHPNVGLYSDFMAGKERRDRDFLGTSCSPLIGTKLGIYHLVTPKFEISAAIGYAFNTKNSSYSSWFADAEMDYIGSTMFFGGGVGIWDFGHAETRTADVFSHVGFLLRRKAGWRPIQLFVEARLPTRNISVRNNYVIWAGVRFYHL